MYDTRRSEQVRIRKKKKLKVKEARGKVNLSLHIIVIVCAASIFLPFIRETQLIKLISKVYKMQKQTTVVLLKSIIRMYFS